MTIRVRFFASLRESIGTGEKIIEAEDAMSVAQVWTYCAETIQSSTNMPANLPANVLIAINQEYVKADAIVNSGDEVAFFPPVTGG